MKILSFIFLCLYKYLNKIDWKERAYYRATVIIGLPITFPLGIILMINVLPYFNDNKIIGIIFFPLFIYLSSFLNRIIFPYHKIKRISYTRKEIIFNIFMCVLIIMSMILLSFVVFGCISKVKKGAELNIYNEQNTDIFIVDKYLFENNKAPKIEIFTSW